MAILAFLLSVQLEVTLSIMMSFGLILVNDFYPKFGKCNTRNSIMLA